MQFFAMTIYIRVAETLPLSFHLLVFTFQFVCDAGIIFNTRKMLESPLHSDVTISRLNNHSAGINFNTCVVVGIGVSGAVCDGLYSECA